MSIRTQIKQWFKTNLKPTQTQFWTLLDNLRFKDEKVPVADVDGIDNLLLKKADKAVVDNHITDEVQHITGLERIAWNNKLGAEDGVAFSTLVNVFLESQKFKKGIEIDSDLVGIQLGKTLRSKITSVETGLSGDINSFFDGDADSNSLSVVSKKSKVRVLADKFEGFAFLQGGYVINPNPEDPVGHKKGKVVLSGIDGLSAEIIEFRTNNIKLAGILGEEKAKKILIKSQTNSSEMKEMPLAGMEIPANMSGQNLKFLSRDGDDFANILFYNSEGLKLLGGVGQNNGKLRFFVTDNTGAIVVGLWLHKDLRAEFLGAVQAQGYKSADGSDGWTGVIPVGTQAIVKDGIVVGHTAPI